MNKSISSLVFAIVSVAAAGSALAQGASTNTQVPVIQVAAVKPVVPVMSHEVATLIKLTHQAEAQYRRSGSPQDLARVKAMHTELASRGFGRATQPAPAVMANDTQYAATLSVNSQFVATAAQ
ncbi:MAG: hypothetical protein PHQ58_09970 [Rhodoferax sp.]|uniref:hypothetical protein n=1 Tax=Rhodoferax sp. TaxID=50421 RepID=UPI00260A1749|nr:hypothetical protein [Rhodoferax sp.]MDD2880754.1 hypothetical protein [Rhodoferax sp.]